MSDRDPKRVVEEGYDRIAERYLAWGEHTRTDERARYAAILLDRLPCGAHVLELGCGAGIPVTKTLAERFQVTGVDLSARQLELARANVPSVGFLQNDMTRIQFPAETFDGVAAFYAITHVPREQHADLFSSVARWLRPGGLFVAALGFRATEGEIEEDWLGEPMYFSHFDSAANQRLLTEAGFLLDAATAETADEDGAPVTFLWVVARKPERE